MEEFVPGHIETFDGITNSRGEILFYTGQVMRVTPLAMLQGAGENVSYTQNVQQLDLAEIGQRVVKAFDVRNRFFHFEFFRLDEDRGALGGIGDFVALEVNMRPAGGYTPDMINYAHSTDVYKIWADMVAYDKSHLASTLSHDSHNALSRPWSVQYYCVFASRRDIYTYKHSLEEVRGRYGDVLVMCERMPEILSGAMGQQMFTVKVKSKEEKDEFIEFIHEKI